LNSSAPIPVEVRGHAGSLLSLTATEDDRFVSCGDDGIARLWDWDDPAASPLALHGAEGTIRSVAIRTDGKDLAAGAFDGRTQLWHLEKPGDRPTLLGPAHESAITALAFSPDKPLLAAGDSRAAVRLLNLSRPDADPVSLAMPKGGNEVVALAYSPDGCSLIVSARSSEPLVFGIHDSSGPPQALTGYGNDSSVIAFCPDRCGRFATAGRSSGTVTLGNLNDLKAKPVRLEWPNPQEQGRAARQGILAASFDAWGRSLVTVGVGGVVFRWDVSHDAANAISGPVVILPQQDYLGQVAALSKDLRRLAMTRSDSSSSLDGVSLWDMNVPTSQPVELRLRAGTINGLSFSPDGHWLVGATKRGDVLLWSMRLDDLIQQAARVVGRNMTRKEWAQYIPFEDYRKTFPNLPPESDGPR
jgi:WD40 repeat protein